MKTILIKDIDGRLYCIPENYKQEFINMNEQITNAQDTDDIVNAIFDFDEMFRQFLKELEIQHN